MTDEEIIALYWAREEKALTVTAERYGGSCYAIARQILASREDAEECVNDTWLRAWNAIPPQRPVMLGAFLCRITRNLALNRAEQTSAARRGGGQLPLVLEELEGCLPAPERTDQAAEGRALAEVLNRFLEMLPAKKRRVFLQRYWYFRPLAEIARENGMSESNVKMTLLRTRAALRRYLEQEGVEL